MKILVTGANGYLGQGIVRSILNKNIEVMPQNFVGVSPLVVLNNVEEKSLPIDNYSQYIDIKKSILNIE